MRSPLAGLLERGKEEEKRTTFGGRRLGHTRARASKARTPHHLGWGTANFIPSCISLTQLPILHTSALKRFLGGDLVSERDINKLIRLDVDQSRVPPLILHKIPTTYIGYLLVTYLDHPIVGVHCNPRFVLSSEHSYLGVVSLVG